MKNCIILITLLLVLSPFSSKSQERLNEILTLCEKNATEFLKQKVDKDFNSQNEPVQSARKEVKLSAYIAQIMYVNRKLADTLPGKEPLADRELIDLIFKEYRTSLADLKEDFYEQTLKDIKKLN